ncbi:MAG TPA: sugar ABC transporter ATP-binding protein [Planctomycetaceae bacterium]|nr:sugar ABC transporter ATP-binding protein [Planctomycetaceae bacterium]HRE99274.1 sugar ABC transporter ATP-binding protein [Pirellulaceae bacterium]
MADEATARWSCRGLSKRFAAPVLRGIDLDLAPGEILALLGANGAGKSTLGRIVAGLLRADQGTMFLEGQPFAPRDKRHAERLGVHIVQQELNRIGTLDVAENLFLNRLPHRFGWIDRRKLEAQATAALEAVGLNDLPLDLPVGQLGIGERQLLEIAAALAQDCRLLILDEPTAALAPPQVSRLFERLAILRHRGTAMIYVSHRLDEIRRIADRVAILRDGVVTDSGAASAFDVERAVEAMSGRSAVPAGTTARPTSTPTSISMSTERLDDRFADRPMLLEVRRLQAPPRVRQVDLQVRAGEIVGLAGLVGSGRTETLRAIFGADRARQGSVRIAGRAKERPLRSPRAAVRAGLGMVPEDRRAEGLLLPASIIDNVTLGKTESGETSFGWLRFDRRRRAVTRAAERTDVRCRDVDQAVVDLSGGNQQKVLVSRWLRHDARVLLVDEPTRGIDVDAKRTLHRVLREWVGNDRGLVVVSSDLDELFELADTIVVMVEGRTVLSAPRRSVDARTLLERAIDVAEDENEREPQR